MAKILETIFRISGELSGSFMGAIATAQGALRGLTRAGTGRFGASFEVGERRLQSMLKRLKETQNALEQFKRLQAAGPGQGGFTKYATEIRRAAEELRRLGVNIKNLDGSSATLRRMIDELRTAQARNRAINDVLAAQRRTSEQHQNFSAAWSNMSNAVTTAQSVLSPLAGSTQTAMQYEAELSRSRALTQMDNINAGRTVQIEREMKMLDERYKEIGRTTRYSAIEAERAGNYLAMAGFTAEQINSGLASMVNLGIANNTELDRTADIFSNIATSMRIEQTAEGYQRLADRTTYLTTHSNQTLTMLDDTMKYVAPIASAMKIDIDDLYSAQKFMVDSGVRGSMAGTALKSFILRSVAPPKKAMEALAEAGIMTPEEMNQNAAFQELMAEEGISIENRQEGESVLMSLIRQYSEKSKDWSDARKTSFIEAWAGKYAAPGVMAMLENGGYEKILAFNRGLKNSDGAAAQTAGVMNDNLQGTWLGLQSAWESASIEVGNAFLPAARSITEGLTGITRSIAVFASENPALIQGLGTLATMAAGGVVAFGAFGLAMTGLKWAKSIVDLARATSAFQMLEATMGGATSVLAKVSALSEIFKVQGLATGLKTLGYAFRGVLTAASGLLFTPWGAALGVLAAGAYMIYKNWSRLEPFFEGLWSQITGAFTKAGAVLTPALENMSSAFEEVKSKLRDAFGGEAGMAQLTKNLEAIGETALTVCGGIVLTLTELFAGLVGALAPALAGVTGLLTDLGAGAVRMLTKLLSGDLAGVFEELWSTAKRIGQDILDIFKGLIENLGGLFSKIGKIIGGLRDGSIVSGSFDRSGVMNYKPANEHVPAVSETVIREVSATATSTPLIERLSRELKEQGRREVTDTTGFEQYMSAVQQALSAQAGLSMEQQQTILTSVNEALSSRLAMQETLEREMGTAPASTLPERVELVEAITALVNKQSDKDEALSAAIEYIKSRDDISEQSQAQMIMQLRELFAKKDETKETGVTRSLETASRSLETTSRSMETASRSMEGLPAKIREAAQQVSAKDETVGGLKMSVASMPATPEAPVLNVEPLQAGLDQAATSSTAFNGALAGTSMSTSSFNSQLVMTGAATGSLSGQLQMVGTTAGMFGVQLMATGGATGAFNAGVTSAGAAASGASGAISGLGAAASSAIGALMSAASSAGSAISGALSSAYNAISSFIPSSIASNAVGGIYPRGEFVTTFAEDSPEAAIPLDGSKRSESLWTKVGRLMGILPAVKETPKPVSIASGSRVKLPWWLPEKWKPKKKTPAPTAAPLPAGVPVPAGYPTAPEEPMTEKIKPPQPSIGRAPTPTFPMSRLPFPLTTPPYVGRTPRKVDGKTLEEALHETERLDREEATFDRSTTSVGMTPAGDLPITVNITFNGSVDRDETKAGVMEGLEAMLERLRHEQARRAYA